MKKYFRKTISILLASILCGSAVACKSKEVTTPSTSQGNQTSTLDTSKKVTVNMCVFSSPGSPREMDRVIGEINKILLEKLNCTIDVEVMGSSDWSKTYNLKLTSGSDLDIIWTATWNNFQANASKGAFMPLDDLINKIAPEMKELIPETGWNDCTIDGKLYAFPSAKLLYVSNGIVYREDLRKKYNLPEISSLETFKTYMEGIKKNEPSIMPYYMVNTLNDVINGFGILNQYHIAGEMKSGYGLGMSQENPREFLEIFASPQFAQQCKTIKELVDEGLYPNNALSNTEPLNSAILSGKAASTYSTGINGFVNSIVVPAKSAHPDWEFKFFSLGTNVGRTFKSPASFSTVALSKDSKNPERAVAVINELFNDEELNRLWNYGMEGVDYKIEDGFYEALNTTATPGFAKNALSTWSESSKYELRTKIYNEIGIPLEKAEDAFLSPDLRNSFVEDFTPYASERAALSQVFAQYAMPLMAGAVPDVDAGIDLLVAKANEAGMQKVITEYKKQWLEYCDKLGVK